LGAGAGGPADIKLTLKSPALVNSKTTPIPMIHFLMALHYSKRYLISMDNKLTIEEIKKWVQNFCEARDWDEYHNAKDLAIGLVTESSELLEIFRFVSEAKSPEVLEEKREAIADELADSLFFILRFAGRFGFDLSQSLERKLEKNVKRYPPKR